MVSCYQSLSQYPPPEVVTTTTETTQATTSTSYPGSNDFASETKESLPQYEVSLNPTQKGSQEIIVEYDITLPQLQKNLLEYDLDILDENILEYDIDLNDDTYNNIDMDIQESTPLSLFNSYLPPLFHAEEDGQHYEGNKMNL